MPGPAQMPVDGVDRHDFFVVMGQVPGDGLRPMVKALLESLSRNSTMRSIVVWGD